MVGLDGETSNPTNLSKAWPNGSQEKSLDHDEDQFDELFTTLAEWNDYLENHVPYFQKPWEPEL